MSIRRQWMTVLILSVVLSVAINSTVFGILINRTFIDYSTESYGNHVAQLEELSQKVLLDDSYTEQQINMQLESHLSDPIKQIRIYDVNGNLMGEVGNYSVPMMSGMMGRMNSSQTEEIDTRDIVVDEMVIGELIITRYSSISDSLEARKFMLSLAGSGFLSFGIVFTLIFIIGIFISRRMSRDLRATAQQAIDIDLGNTSPVPKSKVEEIRTIQHSLDTLNSRLKMKQTSRKKLIDELVHQTRTPLTILRTHLEGFQDGIIEFTPEEVKICETQIENITSIISNMSGMIDAQKELEPVIIEEVEMASLFKQIVTGLKMQFDKKSIELNLISHQKISVKTDRYKLSQVVYNLLTNAYKFTEYGGSVTINYFSQKDMLTIVVEDSGKGISKEEQSKIFNVYFRGDNSQNTSGDGIGLYVVKENLEKIKGVIDLESTVGKGSKFTVRIPLDLDHVTKND
ncbi:HAMP domain-containing sensor histidine kinase [Eubacteriaceae bacterium ES3]|nr:HAMP domain-containing sensor histidine kinase [Eubacteriaceae bacterium ES3]